MGRDAGIKTLRKQLRNVVQELMPEVLKTELATDLKTEVISNVTRQLNRIEKTIQDRLEVLDQRSKDTLGYLVRNTSSPEMIKPGEVPPSDTPQAAKQEG
jgi:hypothetical protein